MLIVIVFPNWFLLLTLPVLFKLDFFLTIMLSLRLLTQFLPKTRATNFQNGYKSYIPS